jgi:hypothetical protein
VRVREAFAPVRRQTRKRSYDNPDLRQINFVRFSGLFRGFVILLCALALELAHDHTMG